MSSTCSLMVLTSLANSSAICFLGQPDGVMVEVNLKGRWPVRSLIEDNQVSYRLCSCRTLTKFGVSSLISVSLSSSLVTVSSLIMISLRAAPQHRVVYGHMPWIISHISKNWLTREEMIAYLRKETEVPGFFPELPDSILGVQFQAAQNTAAPGLGRGRRRVWGWEE